MEYIWNHSQEVASNYTIKMNRPLAVHTKFFDLCRGERYTVVSVSHTDGENIVVTMPAGRCPAEKLEQARRERQFTAKLDCDPRLDLHFE